jgi:hypothetical protein
MALVVPQVRGKRPAEAPWIRPMSVAIIAFIVATVVGNVMAARGK